MTDETTPPDEPGTEPQTTNGNGAHVEAQDTVTALVSGTGTPPTSPNFGIPRYSANDSADFPTQANAITDTLDAAAAKRGAIVDADISASAAIQETKLALATDAAPATGSRRTLGVGAQQALPGNANSANTASLVDLKPISTSSSYNANVGDLVIVTAASRNVALPSAPAISGSQVGVIAPSYDVVVSRTGSDTIQPGGLTTTVKAGTSTVFSYSAGVWYALLASLPGPVGPITAARAYRNGALTLAANAVTPMPVDTIGYDPGGNMNVTTNRYVCPATGYYQVEGQVCPGNSTAAGQSLGAYIYKNGVQYSLGTAFTSSATGQALEAIVSDLIPCNAGDYLQLAYFTNTVGFTIAPGSSINYLSVVQVGNSMNFSSAGGDLTGTYPNPSVVGHTGVTTATTAPAAGGAGALPATPTGYMTLRINGTNRQIPYY